MGLGKMSIVYSVNIERLSVYSILVFIKNRIVHTCPICGYICTVVLVGSRERVSDVIKRGVSYACCLCSGIHNSCCWCIERAKGKIEGKD